MQQNRNSDNSLIITINAAAIVIAYAMLGLSLYLSTEVPLAIKGFWAMSILLLTLSLVNFVKYRFDTRLSEDRLHRLEEAKTEKILEDFVTSDKT